MNAINFANTLLWRGGGGEGEKSGEGRKERRETGVRGGKMGDVYHRNSSNQSWGRICNLKEGRLVYF